MKKPFKHALLGLALLFSVGGCGATFAESLPRAASGLEAAKNLYVAACVAEPILAPEDVCRDAHEGINAVVELYTEVNDAL